MEFDPLAWITAELKPRTCNTDEFIYDHMASQSGECLVGIYQTFDPADKYHYTDYGAALDFLLATNGGNVLDFGPGDGWPSLLIAPYVDHVTGVEGSARRAEVCTTNASRLGVYNAEFIHTPPGSALPFADESFNSVMAATSIEQTADPRATLTELCRVLKPGGRLRMNYEALGRYRDGQERDIWILSEPDNPVYLVIYDRLIESEQVVQYRLTLPATGLNLIQKYSDADNRFSINDLTESFLQSLGGIVVEAVVCTTHHPSAVTWLNWLKEAGFTEVMPTLAGGKSAGLLFDGLASSNRPQSLTELYDLLRPEIERAVRTPAPLADDPPLTAIR